MAKITGPLLSLSASGSIAGTLTAAKWRGRPYIRQRVIPANPQTTGQTQTRSVFSWASNVWKVMPALSVAPWNRFADGQAITGRNRYQGTTVEDNRGQADLSNYQHSIGAKGGIPPTSVVVTPATSSLTFAFTNPTPPSGWTLESAIAAVIRDQDPSSGLLYDTIAVEDDVTQNNVVISGLSNSTAYAAGAWLRWQKADGTIAYSTSIDSIETTTA